MSWETFSLIVGIVGTLAGLLALWLGKVQPRLREHSRMRDRYNGVPANPRTGQEKIPSIFEVLAEQNEVLGVIKHELFANSGKSLRDQTNRIEAALGEHLKACAATPPPTTTVNVNPS
jgi:hypothetical protein